MENIIGILINNLFSVPIIVLIIVIIFRKPLSKIIGKIVTIRWNGQWLEIIFAEENEKNKEILARLNPAFAVQNTAHPVKNQPLKQRAFVMGIDAPQSESYFEGGNKDSYSANQSDKRKPYNDINSDNPKIAIPHIYANIETAVKDKFNISDSSNMYSSLFKEQKINEDTYIVLDSMRSLRDKVKSSFRSKKITKQDIDNYEKNAEGIIEVIEAIEE